MVNSGVPNKSGGASLLRRKPKFSYNRIAALRKGVVLRNNRWYPSAAAARSTYTSSALPTPKPRAEGTTAMPRMYRPFSFGTTETVPHDSLVVQSYPHWPFLHAELNLVAGG